jgi:RNA polymerase sigma-70 factor (ECF subfamily)
MSAEPSFDELMARLRHGEADAAHAVFQRFAQRLIALAGSRLRGTLQHKEDPEDVMQSVFKSFFLRQADGQFALQGWDGLWAVLTVMTLRKCGHRVQYFRAARRDAGRERSLTTADDALADWEAVAREPTPTEAAILTETVEQLMRGLADREREVVALRLQGCTAAEIGRQIGRSERVVQRMLDLVRKRLQRMRDNEEG